MKKKLVLATWMGKQGNYGTCLQSFALHKKLENMGYDVKIISVYPHRNKYVAIIKNILSLIGVLYIINIIRKHPKTIKESKLLEFQKSNYNQVEILTKQQMHRLVLLTDCFVAGSDQIWNTYFKFSPQYFLEFAENAKRIAYASSMGTSSVKEEYKDKVQSLLKKFSHIGVREYEVIDYLKTLTGRQDICQVLDPTFLLDKGDWQQICKKAKYELDLPTDYLFCYFIGNNPNYKEQLLDVIKKLKIDNIIIIPSRENPDFTIENAIIYDNAGPMEFVDLLQRAKFVCTDSFHATALSINFSVPFVEFLRFKDGDLKSQNSRIFDVLNHYNLRNRLYALNEKDWEFPINYENAHRILEQDRKKSIDYLSNAIEY